MAFLDMFRSRPATAAPPTSSYEWRMSVPGIRSAAGMGPEQLYRESPPLRTVVDYIARNVAQLPLKVYVRKGDTERERDTTSPAALTLAHPNFYMTEFEFKNYLVHDALIYGFGLTMPAESKESQSGYTLEYIPASWIRAVKTDGFRPRYYEVMNPELTATQPRWMEADLFVPFGSYDPLSPALPAPPVDTLRDVLVEQINASKFRNQVWGNGGRISGVIKQDPQIPYSAEMADRMEKTIKENFTGNGAKAGGIAYLGPGTTIDTTTFNAHEAEWTDAEKMARQAVAAFYSVNPSMVWGEGQSYASAKDNARSLYTETLAPLLSMIEDRINTFLLPRLGAEPGTYVEFDLQAKLAGNFEEQAVVLNQSVGGPWMTRDEARARMNLPKLTNQDTDQLIVPLNVITGGQASPHDTDTSKLEGPAETKEAPAEVKEQKVENVIMIKGSPSIDDAQDITETFQKFFRRQSKSVLSQIDRARDKGALHAVKEPAVIDPAIEDIETEFREWFDMERWDAELRDDLIAQLNRMAYENITALLEELHANPGDYDEEYVMEYIEQLASQLAHDTNVKTLEELIRAVDDADSFSTDDALKSTPQGVFEFAETKRAKDQGKSVATNIKGWSNIAAVHVGGLQKQATKTWRVTSHNPRPSHMKMNGETIPYVNPKWDPTQVGPNGGVKPGYGEHNRFSNGCRFPGDYNSNVKEVAGCRCEMDIEIKM